MEKMIYNDFNGIKLSALGMGNMRLPVIDGTCICSCINCHSCEKVCPQRIHIPEELAKFAKKWGR